MSLFTTPLKQFDLLDKDRLRMMVLTTDGVKPDIVIIEGVNEEAFIALGERGYLKGDALAEYERRTVVPQKLEA